MEEGSSFGGKWKQFLSSGKRVRWIMAAGIAGISLILLSGLVPEKEERTKPAETEVVSTAEEEAARLEEQLEVLLSEMEGVGSVKVLVTLESGSTYVYAQEKKASSDTASDGGDDSRTRLEQRASTEEKYIFVEDENGRKRALLITTASPVVKGVVIICEGADRAKVKLRVMNAVTVALGISSARVSIEKMA